MFSRPHPFAFGFVPVGDVLVPTLAWCIGQHIPTPRRWEELVFGTNAEDRHAAYFDTRHISKDRGWWVDDDPVFDPFRLCWCPRFGALLVWAVDSDGWLLKKEHSNAPRHATVLLRVMEAWAERIGGSLATDQVLPNPSPGRTLRIQEMLHALHTSRSFSNHHHA